MADGPAATGRAADPPDWEFQRRYGPWAPWHPTRVGRFLAGAPFTWFIAGGWSLEEDSRVPRRHHDDVDLAVLRREVDPVGEWFAGFHLWTVSSGVLAPWSPGRALPEGADQLWVRRDAYTPWLVDVVLTPAEGDDWLYKRDPAIRRPLSEVARRGPDEVVYQRPEITLLFKAALGRDKDLGDLAAVWPRLDEAAREWLLAQMAATDQVDPRWRAALAVLPTR